MGLADKSISFGSIEERSLPQDRPSFLFNPNSTGAGVTFFTAGYQTDCINGYKIAFKTSINDGICGRA